MVIRVNNKSVVIEIKNIVKVNALADYCILYTVNGDKYVTLSTMHNMVKRLGPLFIRVHRSHIINILHVKHFTSSKIYLHHNSSILPVGRLYKDVAVSKLNSR